MNLTSDDSSASMQNSPGAHMPIISKERQRLVMAKQVQLLYQQIPGSIVISAIGASILVFIMWERAPKPILLSWLGCYLLIGGLIYGALWWWFQKANTVDQQPATWGRRFTFLGFFIGLSWGMAGYVCFVPNALGYQLLLFMAMVVPTSMVMTFTMSYKPSFFVAVPPMLTPIALRLALEMDSIHVALSILVVLYAVGLIYFYLNAHKVTIEAIHLRFENLDLVQDLTLKTLEAERANMAKSRFLAAASHDLRQPLHAQVLFLAELKARLTQPEDRNILEYLEGSANSLRQMLNAMLDVSRLDAGVVKPVIDAFPIGQLLHQLQCEFEPQMGERGNRFRVVKTQYFVRSDPALLERILRNLLSNALRYTSQGSVMIGCRKRHKRLTIEVRDSGIGIPQESLDSIFEEFYQLDNPERDREKGLGLGLAIVGRLAKLLQHPVRVTSRLGHGTLVSVDIPLCEPTELRTMLENIQKGEYASLIGTTVLVIDDDALIRKGMNGLLRGWGCESLAVASAQEALVQLKSLNYRPNFILADYRLQRGATGAEAIERVQTCLSHPVPAILITGDTAPERLREAEASGYPILHKPINPAELYAYLHKSRLSC